MYEEPVENNVTRRRFLNWFLGTTAGAFLFSVFYPLTRYLIPPKIEEAPTQNVTLSINPATVKANSGQIFRFGSKPGILIRTPQGQLRAFSAVCTHLGCTVEYRSDLEQIWCACHNGHYNLNGKNVSGPPPRPLEEFTVNVRANQIVVSRSA